MGITVEFKDFNEMVTFARHLLGQEMDKVPAQPERKENVQVPEDSVPVAATNPPASAVPVQASVPVAPVYTAPPTTQAPVSAAVPTSMKEYTLDDLARAGMTLMDLGRQDALQKLLAEFGVAALPALPRDQYGAFATALRRLGAQI